MGVRLTCGVQWPVAASEADRCASVGDALGRLVGRMRAGKTEKDGQAGWAGWLARAEQAEAVCEAYILSLLFLFCLTFHLFCLNSNLVLKFEFQIGAPNLLELLSIS